MNISSTILERYQVRKTRRQKTEFIEFLQANFPGMRVEKNGKLGSRNLVFGDIESAEVVFTAHYDTVVENLLPNLIIPKAPWFRIPYMLLVIAPMVIVMLGVFFGMQALGAGEGVSKACMLAAYVIMFAYMFILGKPNRHTANDNTSGVIAVLEIMRGLSPASSGKAAFVLFDNEEYGCVGSGAFYKAHKDMMQDKLIFNMDCVGEGSNMLFVVSEKAEKVWGERLRKYFASDESYNTEYGSAKKVKFPSDQKHFPMSVALAALRRHRLLGLWVGRIHTRRDTVCSPENIDYICRHACDMVEDI